MSRGWLIWDGVDMRTIAGGTVKIEHVPNHNRAERKVETEKVPGRNGDIVYMQDAWHNVEQKYELVAGTVATTAAATAFREIAEWLYSPVGYCALQDSYEPGYFRRAYFKGPFDVEDMLTRYGRATVTFICRPERFTLDGEEQLTYASAASFTALNGSGSYTKTADHYPNDGSGICSMVDGDLQITLNNPTPFQAKPYFYLYGIAYPTMLDMSHRQIVRYYMPTKQPTADDNFMPFLDKPSIYVGMWGQGNNPDFKVDSSAFDAWTVENSANHENARLKATKSSTGSGQIGMNVAVSPNTKYAITWTASDTAKVSAGVSMYTARGKYIKTVWGDRTGRYLNFTTTGSTYYVVVDFQFETASSNVYIEDIQMQIVESDVSSVLAYVEPINESDVAQLVVENEATGVVTTITFESIDDFLRVDCDTMNVYRNNNQNKNNLAFIDTLEFPVLTSGVNKITLKGRIQGIGIRPRWWTL